MSTTTHMVMWAAVVAVLYALMANRLLKFGERLRVHALELGTKFLNEPGLDAHTREKVEGILCAIPDTSAAWRFALLVVPAVMAILRGKLQGSPEPAAPYQGVIQAQDWSTFIGAAVIATLCNSPAALMLFVVQILFFSFVVSVNKLASALIGKVVGHHHDGDDWSHRPA